MIEHKKDKKTKKSIKFHIELYIFLIILIFIGFFILHIMKSDLIIEELQNSADALVLQEKLITDC